jgi:hypothetical protein
MSDYSLYVVGEDGAFDGLVELDCADDAEALRIAFGAVSPFGHELWREGRFLGWFEAGGRTFEDAAHSF